MQAQRSMMNQTTGASLYMDSCAVLTPELRGANSVFFSSLLDTFCWRGEVGNIFVASIMMTMSSTTSISIDFGRWSSYKLSEAWPIHV